MTADGVDVLELLRFQYFLRDIAFILPTGQAEDGLSLVESCVCL
jgi:hypothetical protein